MASIVLSSIGSSIGNMIVPGLGGRLLGSFGRSFGKTLDAEWGLSSSTSKDGTRLESFKVQDSKFGKAIPVVFGRTRVAGNIVWVSDLIETAHESTVSGGKGGITSSFSSTRTTYTYSLHCAIAIAAGEIGGIQTIWADSKVLYQDGVWKAGVVGSATIYNGTDDQTVDPFLESCIGSGLVPAYRGMAYIVLESLQLGNFGNRLPNLTFEVLPASPTGNPEWLGMADPSMYHEILTNRGDGMPPLTIEGGSSGARRMIVGGYAFDSSQAQFEIAEYDVTGDAPVELKRTLSDAFACTDVADHSWALAKDKRFVALGLQDGGTGKPYRVAIYDAQSRAFGPSISLSMAMAEVRQIVWLDAQRFAVMDYNGTIRGVHVFMRAGLSVVDLGHFDVWGAGSKTSRVPLSYTQFVPYADGVLHFVSDSAPSFTRIEARQLSWKNNTLVVGALTVLVSGVSCGTGNNPQVFLLKTGDSEWTLFYATAIDMRMLSFTPISGGFSVTRPWQQLVNQSYSLSTCRTPLVFGNRIVVVSHSTVEAFYRLSEIALLDGSFSLVTDGAQVEGLTQPGASFGAVVLDSVRLMILVNMGYAGLLGRLDIVKRRNTGDTLDAVVAALLQRAGYAGADYDVSALGDVTVDGYALEDQATGHGALEPLQLLQPFDLVERGGKLVAVKRGQGAAVEIAPSEAGASDADKEKEPAALLSETRIQEINLPVEIDVDFYDASRDYEVTSQKAKRAVSKGTRSVAKITLPLVCTATDGKRIAEDRLYTLWAERTQYRLFLSRAWLGLEPGDIATFDGAKMRITQVQNKNGVLQVDAVSAAPSNVSSAASADGGAATSGAVEDVLSTDLYLMDLPLLRAEDDQPGLYAAATGLDGWSGATLWRAADGVNFTQQTVLNDAATAGAAATALPDRSPHFMDRESVLQVQLLYGELSSCSESDLMNGANAALLGDEIVQFQTASLIGPGLYELSAFLRGRKGTESATGSHAVGEAFVLLTAGTLKFLPAQLSDRNATVHFRAVSNGQDIDFAQDLAFTYALKTLAPYAPAHVTGLRASGTGSDLTLRWVRRARKNAAWVDYIDVPLDETAELYDVEIADALTGAVVRSFSNVEATSAVYTAAQQTADWGASVPALFHVNVYQRSDRYGRGQQATAAI